MPVATRVVAVPPPPGVLLTEPLQAPAGGLLFTSGNGVTLFDAVQSRPGLVAVGPSIGQRVQGVLAFRDLTGTQRLVVGTPTKWWDFNGTTQAWTDRSGGVLLTGSTALPVTFAYWQKGATPRVLGVNGTDGLKSWDPAAASYTTVAAAPVARTLCVSANRVVVGYVLTGGTFAQRVQWSALNDETTWPAAAIYDATESAGANPGGGVIALRPLGRTSVAVYAEWGQYVAVAQPGASDAGAFAFSLQDQAPGPLGPAAVAVTPDGGTHYYLGRDLNLWTFDGVRASLVAPLGHLLRSRLVVATASLAALAYDPVNEVLVVTVPLDTDTDPTHGFLVRRSGGGVFPFTVPTGLPLLSLGSWNAETVSPVSALPASPVSALPTLPVAVMGLATGGVYVVAGTPATLATLSGATDQGSAIPIDWQGLLPVAPGEEWVVSGVEAIFAPTVASMPVTVSIRAGPTLDALTETVLGTLDAGATPPQTRLGLTTPQGAAAQIQARVVIVRLTATASQALVLRRLELRAFRQPVAA